MKNERIQNLLTALDKRYLSIKLASGNKNTSSTFTVKNYV